MCDPRDEAAHDYAVPLLPATYRLSGAARVDEYAAGDAATRVGGRADARPGRRALHRRAPRPGRDLLIVLRTAPSARAIVCDRSGPAGVRPRVPGGGVEPARQRRSPPGTAAFRPRPGWDEMVFKVDGGAHRRRRARALELHGRYAAFRYWFYQ